ncbi:hypothetical protein AAHA92_00324 [Salvia divinorum]|uniref:Uncharacterized protein n=1 Tax=Salvia divinorum TaxID=28513 RepID=A0ABD1IJ64_SALDI
MPHALKNITNFDSAHSTLLGLSFKLTARRQNFFESITKPSIKVRLFHALLEVGVFNFIYSFRTHFVTIN